MKARDVLATVEEAWWDEPVNVTEWLDDPSGGDVLARTQESALLAQTPEGEGVYLAPDGTLMRAQRWDHIAISSRAVWIFVPIEGDDQ